MLLAMALTAKSAVDRHFEVMDAQNTITSPDQPAPPRRTQGCPQLQQRHVRVRGRPGQARSSRTSPWTSGRAKPWPWWASRAAARAPCSSWSPACTTSPAVPSPSTAWTCASSTSRSCARVVAVAFEDTTLFSSSVRDNVLLGAPSRIGGGPRGGPGGSPRRRPGPLRVLAAGRRGHADRRGGPQPLRRPAPAHRPGPGHRRAARACWSWTTRSPPSTCTPRSSSRPGCARSSRTPPR